MPAAKKKPVAPKRQLFVSKKGLVVGTRKKAKGPVGDGVALQSMSHPRPKYVRPPQAGVSIQLRLQPEIMAVLDKKRGSTNRQAFLRDLIMDA